MIYFVIIGILALIYDLYILRKYPRHDYTISEYIYKFVHKYPIVAVVIGGALLYFFPNDIQPIVVGILVGHFVWKA
jgi:hypothetical protein